MSLVAGSFLIIRADPLISTARVRVYDGTDFIEIEQANSIRIRARHAGGQASFFIPDATIAQKDLCRQGRECEIVLIIGGETITFGGYISTPILKSRNPLHFDLAIKVEDLTHGAAWYAVRDSGADLGDEWVPATDYVDIIKDIFSNSWPGGIDVTGVDANALDTAAGETYQIHYDYIGRSVNKIVKEYLQDWVWFIKHNGTDSNGIIKKVFVTGRGSVDRTGTIELTEETVGYKWQMQPIHDPRSLVIAVGDDDPSTDLFDPLFASSESTASVTAYGERELIMRVPEAKNTLELLIVAQGISEVRNFDLNEIKLRVYDWTLKPNDKILLYLPTVNIDDGAGGGVEWVVKETEDRYHQNRPRRWVVLRETRATAALRVG